MRITDVRVFLHYSVWRNITFVRIDTDEGITGIGEATIRNKETAVKAAIENHLRPMVIGMSPFDIEKFFHMAFIRDPWRNGAVFNTAISGIETAMWDIIGQKLGQPVCNLIGGKLRDRIPVYANSWFEGAKTVDDFAEAAVNVVKKGFKAIKWDPLKTLPADAPETKRVDAGISCLEAVRNAVGDDIELFIELHGSLSYDGALRYAIRSEKYNPGFLEEPMHPDDFTGYRKLAMKSNVPIAAGERYFTRFSHRALNEEGFYSIVQPDLQHCGGILETRKIASAAETYGLKFAPHNSGGPVGTMASVMADCPSPNFFYQEFSIENFDLSERFFRKGLDYSNGCINVSDTRPGLGLIPDWEAIEKEDYRHIQTF